MDEKNFRQQYNDFIGGILEREKVPEFSGEEGREKLLMWIRDYLCTISLENNPEPPALENPVAQMVEEAMEETVKEMTEESKVKNQP